ncbi:hypothetical protein TNIN_112021 [Trichonephila inaurata madagascariensis]|uniref:Uncharacterized protein n=1 Tax=Trichonephila inaurata madagascariensis TaxID=2747483 RepID=A0A8X6X656_9ARAC|nr:hypothetical protein TNIN_112021 [Trichonephila inaurata madagascariensis]
MCLSLAVRCSCDLRQTELPTNWLYLLKATEIQRNQIQFSPNLNKKSYEGNNEIEREISQGGILPAPLPTICTVILRLTRHRRRHFFASNQVTGSKTNFFTKSQNTKKSGGGGSGNLMECSRSRKSVVLLDSNKVSSLNEVVHFPHLSG